MHINITDLLLSEQGSEMKKKDLFSHFHKHEGPIRNDEEYTPVLCSFINNTILYLFGVKMEATVLPMTACL